MGDVDDTRLSAAMRLLANASHLCRADDVPRVAQDVGHLLGARRTTIYLVDYDQVVLSPFTPEPARVLPIEGTIGGRTFSDVTVQVTGTDDVVTAWLPLLDGTERVGVLQLDFEDASEFERTGEEACRAIASLLAELVVTRAEYGDAIERIRRRMPLTVAAELQWTLLPPLTFVTHRVAISGVLAPTASVAGDSFDYAVNGDTAHVAVLDAMGHGIEATLICAVAVSALRNARRSGAGLVEAATLMDAEIEKAFGEDRFVTAVLGELHLPTGVWSWVSCGHPPALVVRHGRVVKVLDEGVAPPLGLGLDLPEVRQERLEPGDRLLLYTDGVIEARDAAGQFFGSDRLVQFVSKEAAAGRPAPETLRRLGLAILAYQEGELQDDATTVVVEWLTNQEELTTP